MSQFSIFYHNHFRSFSKPFVELLNILEKLPYSSLCLLLDWNSRHSLCNYLFYEILDKALYFSQLHFHSSEIKIGPDDLYHSSLSVQNYSKSQFLVPHFLDNFFWRWWIYILSIPEKEERWRIKLGFHVFHGENCIKIIYRT